MKARANGDILELCKAKGLRLTGPRRVIAKVLTEATDHPDAIALHRRAMEIDPGIAIATVYRTVSLLQEKGILERHTFSDGRARYEPADREHHDHFIDIETGKIVEFKSDAIEKLQEELARQHGYRIISHRLEIYVEPIANTSNDKTSNVTTSKIPTASHSAEK